MDLATHIRMLLERGLDRTPAATTGPRSCQSAAVLVPVVVDGSEPELLLTRRTQDVETHKGQVSFPGGLCDQQDAGPADTALREAQEELGIPPDYVEVMGFLPEVWTPTGFCIIPVVGVLRTVPPLVPSVQEVAEVFRVPLKFFAQPGRMEQRIVAGSLREVWFYDFEEKVIWGATALMIRMLLEKIGPPTALRP